MSEHVYLNDRIVPAEQASIRISNPAFLHGVGLFETLRTYRKRPFRLNEHLARLNRSAQKLQITIGRAGERVASAIQDVLSANSLSDARVRITLTPPGTMDENEPATLLVAATRIEGYGPDLYRQGMTVMLCTDFRQSQQDPLAGHKTTSYLPRLVTLRTAQSRGCGESIWFTPQNLLAEGAISNVFVVKQDKVRTPPLDTPVLPGITRAAIIELAARNGIELEECSCNVNELLDADEVFLTNSVMEVMPVCRIERRSVGNEKPGAITSRLAQLYAQLVEQETAGAC